MTKAKLTLASGQEIEKPSENDINSALKNISKGGDNSFLIIDHGKDLTYMRVSGDPYSGFSLEYQNGDITEHYNSIDENLGFNLTLSVLQKYSENDIEWKKTLEWKKHLGTKIRASIGKEKLMILLLLVILVMFGLAIGLSDNPFAKK